MVVAIDVALTYLLTTDSPEIQVRVYGTVQRKCWRAEAIDSSAALGMTWGGLPDWVHPSTGSG